MKSIQAFQTSDGQIFTNEAKAIEHENDINCGKLDKLFRDYSSAHPEVHWPNLSLSLVPYMIEHKDAFYVTFRNMMDWIER